MSNSRTKHFPWMWKLVSFWTVAVSWMEAKIQICLPAKLSLGVFRYFVGNFWKWKISRKYLRAPTAYYLIHEGVEEKESRQVRFHFWAAGSGVGHRLKIDWNINQELLDIGDGGMYNVLPDISLIYLRTAKRGSIYIGKGSFPTGFISIIILSYFNSWLLDLYE